MKNFNSTRFIHTLRWQLAERKAIYTFAAVGLLFTILPTVVFPLVGGSYSSDVWTNSYAETAAIWGMVASAWYVVTCGALIVDNLGTKQRRISTFMLPASRLEKFAARYLYLLIALPLAFFVGCVAGDLLQMGVSQALMHEAYSAVAIATEYAWTSAPRLSLSFGSWLLAVELLVLLPHSIFLVTGTFFRRHAWILSNVTLLIASVVFSLVMAWLSHCIVDALCDDGIYRIGIVTTAWAQALYALAVLAVVAFNYWAAFRIYSRQQAVGNKLINF